MGENNPSFVTYEHCHNAKMDILSEVKSGKRFYMTLMLTLFIGTLGLFIAFVAISNSKVYAQKEDVVKIEKRVDGLEERVDKKLERLLEEVIQVRTRVEEREKDKGER